MRALYVIFLLAAIPAAFAHGADAWQELGIIDPLNVLYVGVVISAAFLAHAVVAGKRLHKTAKKISFVAIAVPIIIVTLYLAFSTAYLNVASASGGPVHWHADFEVWACGERLDLVDPHSLDNKVGEATVHEHADSRIHIEGVLLHMEDASVGEFFESVGGEFTEENLAIPTNHGLMTWRNGDMCNGLPGRWMMFVNGDLEELMGDYIIAPYSTVPPGDKIKIVFTEKDPLQVNPELFEEP